MKKLPISICLIIGMICSTLFIHTVEPEPYKARVGVYDNRAIAIAYAASQFNPVSEKMKEYKIAKDAGDSENMEALEKWGEKHQRQLHRQGFGRVPVDDLLAHVQQQFPDFAKALNVDVIAMQCDYIGPGVEQVDITDELAALFNPSEKTLKHIKNIKDHKPVDLDELGQHQD